MSRVLYRSYWRVAGSHFDMQKGLRVQKHWEVSGVLLCLIGGEKPGNSKGLVCRLQNVLFNYYFMKLLIYSSQCDLCVVQPWELEWGGRTKYLSCLQSPETCCLYGWLWLLYRLIVGLKRYVHRNPHFVPFRASENISISAWILHSISACEIEW